METLESRFNSGDLQRIAAETFVEDVDFHPELPSTSDRALELAGDATGRLPLLVLADEQTAGRGRGTNRWFSARGSLTFSVLIDTATTRIAPAVWPQVSLTAGLAVCDALDEFVGGGWLGLKWPNDVLCDGRKICGILAEAAPRQKNRLVIGIGTNVNNRFDGAPPELHATVTSLCEIAGRRLPLPDVLIAMLRHLAAKLLWISDGREQLQQQWQQRCVLTGRTVELEVADRCHKGLCRGIDGDGALLLETPTGKERFLSGVIRRWE